MSCGSLNKYITINWGNIMREIHIGHIFKTYFRQHFWNILYAAICIHWLRNQPEKAAKIKSQEMPGDDWEVVCGLIFSEQMWRTVCRCEAYHSIYLRLSYWLSILARKFKKTNSICLCCLNTNNLTNIIRRTNSEFKKVIIF